MARGGFSSDPDIRRRQQEGLERGRRIAAERRRQGLPTKRKERELEQRVIEGGVRDGGNGQRGEESGGAATTRTRQTRRSERRERQPTPTTTSEEDDVRLPFWAPLYTGKRNDELLAELADAEADS